MDGTKIQKFDLKKLEACQDRGDVLRWLSVTLSDMKQRVCADANGMAVDKLRFLISPKLEQELQVLQTSAEMRFSEINAEAELSSSMLFRALARAESECQGLTAGVEQCQADVGHLQQGLRCIGGEPLNNLAVLSDIDVLKRRLSLCRHVLMVVQQWDGRARELELLLKEALQGLTMPLTCSEEPEQHLPARSEVLSTGKTTDQDMITLKGPSSTTQHLLQAVHHIVAIKKATRYLKDLSFFSSKCAWISGYEMRFLAACTLRLTDVIRSANEQDFVQHAQIFQRLGVCDKFEEAVERSFNALVVQAFSFLWPQTGYARYSASCAEETDKSESLVCSTEANNHEILVKYFQQSSSLLVTCMQLFHAADQAISSRWSSDHKRLINYLLKAIFSTPFAAFEELMHSLSTNDVTVTIFESSLSSFINALETGFNAVADTVRNDLCYCQSDGSSNKPASLSLGGMSDNFWDTFCSQHGSSLLPKAIFSLVDSLVSQRLTSACWVKLPLRAGSTPSDAMELLKAETKKTLTTLSEMWSNENETPAATSTFPLLNHAIASPSILMAWDGAVDHYWDRWGTSISSLVRSVSTVSGGTTAAAERTRTAVGVERLATPSVMLTLHRGINDILAEVAYAGLKSAIQAVWKHCCSVWCSETPFAVAGHAVAFNYHASNPDQKKLLQLLEKERENSSAFKISADKTMTVPDLQHIAPRTVARFRHTVAQAHENLLHIALEPLKRSLKHYAVLPIWTATCEIDQKLEEEIPTATVISVSEYLLSLVPYFDLENDSDTHAEPKRNSVLENHNNAEMMLQPVSFVRVLNATSIIFCDALRSISNLSPYGQAQLAADVAYLERSLVVLGHDTTELRQCADALLQ